MGSGILIKKAILKYGVENFKKRILIKDIIFKEIIDELEKEFIAIYKDLGQAEYNIAKGGTGGFPQTEETKRKIGEGNRGKIISKETRHKMKKNHADVSGEKNPMYGKTGEKCPNFGRHFSEEHKRKIRESNKGKIVSEKSIQRMRESQKKRRQTEKQKS
jgi:hypothetical protein